VVTAPAAATLSLKRAGAVTSEVFNLGDRVTVGRFDAETGPVDVDLGPLPEAMYISRQHAEIFKNPEGKWMIRDLGSSNGTFLRNPETGKFERIQGEQEIKDGDEIALGNARFVFNAK
jgi:pSer/pThr/pTyr-binding forkhead associated (FHA) protein